VFLNQSMIRCGKTQMIKKKVKQRRQLPDFAHCKMSNNMHINLHQPLLFKSCMSLANIKNWIVKNVELFFIVNIQKYSHTGQEYGKVVVC
jgi:hypothetical protein